MTKGSAFLAALATLLIFRCRAQDEPRRFVVKPPEGRKLATMLSLDGGGLRGLAANQILVAVEDAIRKHFFMNPKLLPREAWELSEDQLEVHLADFFDVIGGVSAGSWLGLYYASKGGNGAVARVLDKPDIITKYGRLYPGSARGMDIFFQEYGDCIFPAGIIQKLPRFDPTRGSFPFTIPGINSPMFSSEGLEETLDLFLGDTKLTDLHTSFIAPVYDVNNGCPVLFSFSKQVATPFSAATIVQSRSAPRFDVSPEMAEKILLDLESIYHPDLEIRYGQDFFAKDVARGSSAFPTLLPAKQIYPIGNDSNHLYHSVDGAVISANPILHTSNFLARMQQVPDLANHAILSVGTGSVIGKWQQDVGRGALGWMLSGDLMIIISVGGSEAIQSNFDFFVYNVLQLPLGQYLRIQMYAEHDTPEADALNSISDPNHLGSLKTIGQKRAAEYSGMIRTFVRKYLVGSDGNEKYDKPSPAAPAASK